jgi:hypothetical protein
VRVGEEGKEKKEGELRESAAQHREDRFCDLWNVLCCSKVFRNNMSDIGRYLEVSIYYFSKKGCKYVRIKFTLITAISKRASIPG